MSSLELAVTPGLVFRFDRPPATLAVAIAAYLGRGDGSRSPTETVIRVSADPPPAAATAAADRGDLLLAEAGLEVRARGEVLTFEHGGIVGWCDGQSGRGGVHASKSAGDSDTDAAADHARGFVSLALAPLLIELAETRGWLGLHAAAIAVDGHGVVLPGPSGAGKSTVFLQSHLAGLDVLSDDLVWLALTDEGFCLHPFPRGFVERVGLEAPPLPSVWTAPVAAVVCPRVADRDASRLVPIPAGEAVDVLVAESAFLLPGGTAADRFRSLVRLAGSVPAYRLEAGRRRRDVAPLLERLVADLPAPVG